MGWFNWTRKPIDDIAAGVGTLGVDITSSRLRAMTSETGRPPRALLLEDPHEDLPLAVTLERPTPDIGRPALAIARKTPHLACLDFLAELGQPREWKAGKHRVTAADLLGLAFARLRAACPRPDHLTLTLPVYLSPPQVTSLTALLDKAGLPVRGSIVLPLALLAAADPASPRPHVTLVVDADDRALTGSLVQCESNQARLLGVACLPRLNTRAWKDRILDALADRCVRTCRRDPRDTPSADQALFDQIDDALDRLQPGQKVTLTVRGGHWYQDLVQQTDDFDGYCTGLVRQATTTFHDLVQQSAPEPPGAVWMTQAAARLPGLAAALHDCTPARSEVRTLPADAGPRAAVAMAGRWVRDELPRTHLDHSVLLPEGAAARPAARDAVASIRAFRFDH